MPGKKTAKAVVEDFEVKMPEPMRQREAVEAPPKTMLALEELALSEYDPANRTYSTVLGSTATTTTITQDDIESYAVSPQSDKEKTLEIINVVRQYINKDDIIGLTMDAIESSVNTKCRFYWHWGKGKSNGKANQEVKDLIAEFNEKINLPYLIRTVTTTAYQDGNCILYLRSSGKPQDDEQLADYVVDMYPIGVAEVSQYKVGGDPYVVIDINVLKTRLRKTYTKTRKNKALFYENEGKEIAATYPAEVNKAYKDGERYAKLDIRYSGVVRTNDQGMQYGLSAIFRALSPAVMLETFAKADRLSAKARAKKIIAQYMNKEILGPTWDKDTLKQQAYAQKTLLEAWRNPIVVVTPPATVSKIEYVEPKAEMTDIDTVNYYRNRELSALGVSFLASSDKTSAAVTKIGVSQLMKQINKITRQLETILNKWYRIVLQEAGFEAQLAPTVQIIDAETMEMNLRMNLADLLFNKMNLSFETTLDLLGYSVDDEKAKREAENADGLSEIFTPRQTAYTNSGGSENEGGRPAAEDSDTPDKQADDKARNDAKRE